MASRLQWQKEKRYRTPKQCAVSDVLSGAAMKPYAFSKRWMWRDEDAGPTTKFTGSGYRKRRIDRRLYNKRTRRMAEIALRKEIAEYSA